MRPTRFQPKDLLKLFARKKVLTKPEFLDACGCSTMTAWRILHQAGYLTSYNYNARYYTLAHIPQFDEQGLWAYRDVRFSKWGTLPRTLLGLIEPSEAGRTAAELEPLLHLANVKPTLTRLATQGMVQRARIGGTLVYLSVDEVQRQQQILRREEEVTAKRRSQTLPDLTEVNALLVEMIRRPQGNPRQWARRLTRREIHLTTVQIETVIDHYRLSLKKGPSNS